MHTREKAIPNYPRIYRVISVDGEHETPTDVFRVRRRVHDGKKWTTRTETVTSFAEAKRISKQKPPSPGHTVTVHKETFQSAFAKFMVRNETEMKLSAGTLSGYRNRYQHLRFFDPMPVRSITAKTLDTWIDLLFDPKYLQPQQGSRINYEHETTLLTTFFRYFKNYVDETLEIPILDRHRKRTSARKKSDRKEVRFLKAEEELDFLGALARWPTIRDLAIFQLHTGVRVGEAAALDFKQLDFRRGEVRIDQHLHWDRRKDGRTELIPGTKTGPARTIPLTPECASMLRQRLSHLRSGHVFPNAVSQWLTYREIQSRYDAAFRKMSVPQTGTHTLRHTFAVRFLDQTKDIYSLQRLLGHSDLKTTQIYAKYSNESVRRSFQCFRGGLAADSDTHVPNPVPKLIS